MRGAILIGILAITAFAMLADVTRYGGVISLPPSVLPTLFKLDLAGVVGTGLPQVILVFVLVEVFDATETLIGVARRAGLTGPGHESRLGRALLADSIAIIAGALLGTSGTTATSRAPPGCRRAAHRLTALTVAVLFLAALLFAPWPARCRPTPRRRPSSTSPC